MSEEAEEDETSWAEDVEYFRKQEFGPFAAECLELSHACRMSGDDNVSAHLCAAVMRLAEMNVSLAGARVAFEAKKLFGAN